MKILNLSSLWQLCKWIALVAVVCVVLHAGISPSVICFLLLIRLAIRLLLKLIGGVIQIAFVFIILWLLTLIF